MYIANLAGASVTSTEARVDYRTTLPHALAFIAGFSLIFVGLGASAGILGSLMLEHMVLLRQIAGGLLVFLGFHLTGMLRIPLLYRETQVNYSLGNNPSYVRSFLIGSAFALGWTPCVGPILGAILTLAWNAHSMWKGVYLLAVYSLGLGVPFLVIAVALTPATRYLRQFNRHLNLVSLVSGILIIAIGVLMLTDSLTKLSEHIPLYITG